MNNYKNTKYKVTFYINNETELTNLLKGVVHPQNFNYTIFEKK